MLLIQYVFTKKLCFYQPCMSTCTQKCSVYSFNYQQMLPVAPEINSHNCSLEILKSMLGDTPAYFFVRDKW